MLVTVECWRESKRLGMLVTGECWEAVKEVGYAGYCGVLGMVRELEGMLVAVGCIHFAAFKWVSLWRKISFCWYQCREERDQKKCCNM